MEKEEFLKLRRTLEKDDIIGVRFHSGKFILEGEVMKLNAGVQDIPILTIYGETDLCYVDAWKMELMYIKRGRARKLIEVQ